MSDVLGAAVSALRELGGRSRLLVILRHYYGVPADKAAEVAGLEKDQARELYEQAVVTVYDQMLRAAI